MLILITSRRGGDFTAELWMLLLTPSRVLAEWHGSLQSNHQEYGKARVEKQDANDREDGMTVRQTMCQSARYRPLSFADCGSEMKHLAEPHYYHSQTEVEEIRDDRV